MKVIKLVSVSFENFKKLNRTVEFGEKKTQIFAMNRTGKSSMADGIFWVLFGKSSTGKSEGKEFRPSLMIPRALTLTMWMWWRSWCYW